MLEDQELNTVLQERSNESRVEEAEEKNPVPRLVDHIFDAAQDVIGFLSWEHTLLAHVQFSIHLFPTSSAGLLSNYSLSSLYLCLGGSLGRSLCLSEG